MVKWIFYKRDSLCSHQIPQSSLHHPPLSPQSLSAVHELMVWVVEFRQGVIGYDDEYVTTQSDILYSDYQTVVFMKRQVIMVLSNAGSTSDPYTITIPMTKATMPPQTGTPYTDIIACATSKIASTNHLVVTILTGMPQVPPSPPTADSCV